VTKGYGGARVAQGLRDRKSGHMGMQAQVCMGTSESVRGDFRNTCQAADSLYVTEQPCSVVIEDPVGRLLACGHPH
jgi:hypothetical protein